MVSLKDLFCYKTRQYLIQPPGVSAVDPARENPLEKASRQLLDPIPERRC
jgi:hypothetical protein